MGLTAAAQERVIIWLMRFVSVIFIIIIINFNKFKDLYYLFYHLNHRNRSFGQIQYDIIHLL
ncbi:MAG: hypothetical protein Kow0019_04200 [Methanobacteriaceae archaeon]